MFDFSWSNILHSNVINFIIMVSVFAVIIKKLNVGQKIEDMRDAIQKTVEESDFVKEEAKKDYESVAGSLANIDEELSNIVEKAEITAKSFEEKSKEDLERAVETIKKNIDKQVQSEENNVQAQLMKKVSASSIEVAQRQIVSTLEKDKTLHRKYIAECIENIEEIDV